MAESIPFKFFKVTHPDYDPSYWARCKALYTGGKELLRNDKVLCDVFPRHMSEAERIYDERKQRAYYLPYAGAIVDMMVSELFAEQLAMASEPAPDAFYDEFYEDVSQPGGKVVSFNDFLKQQVLSALICKRSWSLVDLPKQDGAEPQSLAEQEATDALRAYACIVDPESVKDWEMTGDGVLKWVLLGFEKAPRNDLKSKRNMVTLEFVHYTQTEWTKYEVTYDREKHPDGPNDNDLVPAVAGGPITIGRVPLSVMELPDGLWAMGKLESLAAAHMNKTNALAWAEYKTLFPPLVHFGGPVELDNPISENPNRATSQVYGPGHIVEMAAGDRMEYLAPRADVFSAAMQDLAVLRDEMYRVTHHMAQSIDNSAAALQRSADSKQVDQAMTAIVLKALAQIITRHAIDVYELVGLVRGDGEIDWTCKGMDQFGTTPVADQLQQAQTLDLISIPSATFQILYKSKLAKAILGEDADDEDRDKIDNELNKAITQDQFETPTPMDQFVLETQAVAQPAEEKDEEEEEEKPAKKPAKKAKAK